MAPKTGENNTNKKGGNPNIGRERKNHIKIGDRRNVLYLSLWVKKWSMVKT